MNTIWHNLPRPFFVLAPMEAVTDVVFRHVVMHAGRPDIFITEFTNATGWAHAGERAIGGRLIKTDEESPIIAQLWGSDTDAMKQLSIQCREWGYDGIDINMGCPDKAAIKGGGGAHMIRTPETAASIITAAKESGLPISVKTRLGYTYIDEWRDWLTHILKQDVTALTVHLRTKKEMSKVPAHFELIPEIKALRDEIAPDTLLIINGDIENREMGERLAREYGIDGIMIGRGVFKNPFVFSGITETSTETRMELLRYHLDMYDMYVNQLHRPFDTLKRFFKIYVNSFDGAAELRDKLMHTTTTKEVRQLLDTAGL